MTIKEFDNFKLNENRNKKIWRYISIDRLEDLLKTNSIFFPTARQLSEHDPFEGSISNAALSKSIPGVESRTREEVEAFKRIYQTSYNSAAFESLLDMYHISCWHKSEYESFLMWKVYAKEKSICIQTTIGNLCNFLGEYSVNENANPEDIWIGDVNYIDFEMDAMNSGMLDSFFYKRIQFQDEKEFRLVLSLRMAVEFGAVGKEATVRVPIDPSSMIDKVYILPSEDEEYENEARFLLEHYGFSHDILIHSKLSGLPAYGP